MAHVGDLPMGCAAVCNASISVQRLGAEAAVQGDDTLLRQAMLMDPLAGAVCNPAEIWQMCDELLVAQERWLPQYKKAIAAAKRRLAKGPLLKLRPYTGAIRLKEKTVADMQKNANLQRRLAAATDKTRVEREANEARKAAKKAKR
jgi:alpha-galactosidase